MRPMPVLLLKTHNVVFDGYDETSTKKHDATEKSGRKSRRDCNFRREHESHSQKGGLLSNPRNKRRFINMLSWCLQQSNCPKYQAKGDADVRIVKTAVEYAQVKYSVLVGEDTDLLVLLRFYIRLDSRDGEKEELKKTFMESEAIKKQLGRSDVRHNMVFIHSVLGCDTTSRFYEIGKATASEKYTNSSTLEGKRRSSTCISPWMMYC